MRIHIRRDGGFSLAVDTISRDLDIVDNQSDSVDSSSSVESQSPLILSCHLAFDPNGAFLDFYA
jgi:hypothetical protein